MVDKPIEEPSAIPKEKSAAVKLLALVIKGYKNPLKWQAVQCTIK